MPEWVHSFRQLSEMRASGLDQLVECVLSIQSWKNLAIALYLKPKAWETVEPIGDHVM